VKSGHEKDRPRIARPIFIKFDGFWSLLLAILLDTGGTKSSQTMLVDGKLPGKEFIDRQGVSAASLLKGEQAAANRGNDFSLPANDPPFGSGRGQIRNGKRAAVGPDDVFHPRAMGFCHGVLTNS
jgi:hypothetical protein